MRVIEERVTAEEKYHVYAQMNFGEVLQSEKCTIRRVGIGVITIWKTLKLSIRHRSLQKTRI
jgi:hypothetical protein